MDGVKLNSEVQLKRSLDDLNSQKPFITHSVGWNRNRRIWLARCWLTAIVVCPEG